MDDLDQLAWDTHTAFLIMATPDAREIEFLPLKPSSYSEMQSLDAHWAGRDLRAAGVIGRVADGPVAAGLKIPFDQTSLAALLRAFYQFEAAEIERLYSLQDARLGLDRQV